MAKQSTVSILSLYQRLTTQVNYLRKTGKDPATIPVYALDEHEEQLWNISLPQLGNAEDTEVHISIQKDGA